MRNATRILTIATTLTLLPVITSAQQVIVKSPAEQADELLKEKKYDGALALYNLALKNAKSETPEQILKNRDIIARKALIYSMQKRPAMRSAMLQQCYEYSSDAAKKFPNNVIIAQTQIADLSFLASDYSRA